MAPRLPPEFRMPAPGSSAGSKVSRVRASGEKGLWSRAAVPALAKNRMIRGAFV